MKYLIGQRHPEIRFVRAAAEDPLVDFENLCGFLLPQEPSPDAFPGVPAFLEGGVWNAQAAREMLGAKAYKVLTRVNQHQ